jgi:pimeloyl-ACP methyl ester carboxylesterase
MGTLMCLTLGFSWGALLAAWFFLRQAKRWAAVALAAERRTLLLAEGARRLCAKAMIATFKSS